MSPLDLQDTINRIRHDINLDPEVAIRVYDLAYLEPLVAWLDTLKHSTATVWWAVSDDGGIATTGEEADVRKFCADYPRYQPREVEVEEWFVQTTHVLEEETECEPNANRIE